MYMTEQDIEEFVNALLKDGNYFISKDGAMLFTQEMSRKIASENNIDLVEGAVLDAKEVVPYLLQMEDIRRASAASRAKIVETPVEPEVKSVSEATLKIIEVIEKYDRNNVYAMASAILEELPHLAEVQRSEAIAYAEKEGIIDSAAVLNNALKSMFKKISFSKKVSELKNNNVNDQEFVNAIVKSMITNQVHNILRYYFMKQVLNDPEIGLDEKLINQCTDSFLVEFKKVIVREFNNTTANNSTIAHTLLKKYTDMDMRYLIDCLKDVEPPLNIEKITYLIYLNEDVHFVEKILIDPDLSVEEKAIELRKLELQFPAWCVKGTIDTIRKQGSVKFPFDEIYKLYIEGDQADNTDAIDLPVAVVDANNRVIAIIPAAQKEQEEESSTELIPAPPRDITELPVEPDFEDVPNLIDLEDEEATDGGPKKWTITERKVEERKIEKKKTIACILVAAGGISTALLAAVYNADPLTSATNCFAAMEPLFSKLSGILELLPSKVQFISILAAMGGTIAASVRYYKLNKKGKKLSKEIANEEETIVVEGEVVEDEELVNSEELDEKGVTRGGRK